MVECMELLEPDNAYAFTGMKRLSVPPATRMHFHDNLLDDIISQMPILDRFYADPDKLVDPVRAQALTPESKREIQAVGGD